MPESASDTHSQTARDPQLSLPREGRNPPYLHKPLNLACNCARSDARTGENKYPNCSPASCILSAFPRGIPVLILSVFLARNPHRRNPNPHAFYTPKWKKELIGAQGLNSHRISSHEAKKDSHYKSGAQWLWTNELQWMYQKRSPHKWHGSINDTRKNWMSLMKWNKGVRWQIGVCRWSLSRHIYYRDRTSEPTVCSWVLCFNIKKTMRKNLSMWRTTC